MIILWCSCSSIPLARSLLALVVLLLPLIHWIYHHKWNTKHTRMLPLLFPTLFLRHCTRSYGTHILCAFDHPLIPIAAPKILALIYAIHFGKLNTRCTTRQTHDCVHHISDECKSICKASVRASRMLHLAAAREWGGRVCVCAVHGVHANIEHYLFLDATTKYRNELKLLVLFD